mgnify:CR=1 FL=1|jgi:hypothetical protein
MQALSLPAASGWHWLSEGFRLFRKNHAMLTLLVISYWLLMALISRVPLLGTLVGTVCIPAFSVSLMNVCQSIDRGGPVNFRLLFSGFASYLRPLLVLGAIYLVATVSILGLSSLFDDGVLMRMFLAGHKPPEEALQNGSLLIATQLALVLFAPLMMAYWYAPVLTGWHGLPPGKALFFSFVACARNWRAFMVYGLAIAAIATLLPMLLLGIVALLLPAGTGLLTLLLTMLIVLVLAPTMFASFYVSYRDVFVSNHPRA